MALPLYQHLIEAIVIALDDIFLDNRYADKVIEKMFKQNRKWGSRDRKFVAETIYEIVRHKRRLEYIIESDASDNLVAAYLFQVMNELPDWEEFQHIDLAKLRKRNSEDKPPQVANSFPDWMHELGTNEFGEQWPKIMNALNKPAEVFLRVNTLKAAPEPLIKELANEEITAEKVQSPDFELPSTIKLVKRKNVFTTQAFRNGYFEVQDAGSQLIGPLLQVSPGMRVVDACAGAGGKSLHLAALMKNKGKIIAMDIHDWKLKELKTRAARNGVDIIETKVIESNKTIKRLENSFDRVLLDVPCSGMGVIRRNPDTKWKLTMEEIERLILLQREIISTYSSMCKAGGKMVYATCSILNRENEDQVKWFLASEAGQSWTLEKEERVWPHIHGFDGFYAAVLAKK